MKILEIKDGRGYFKKDKTDEWLEIDKISKNGLLALLNLYLEEDAEMDDPREHHLPNQVHNIIYSHIFDKLAALAESKSSFRDDSERLYFDEINKYSSI